MVHTDYLEQIIDEAHNAVRKQLSFGLPKPSPIAETAANIFYSITEAEDCKRSLIQRCRDLVVGATKEEYGKTHWEFGIAANLVFTWVRSSALYEFGFDEVEELNLGKDYYVDQTLIR